MSDDAISYQAIYLSPHLDDAVLSCGGQIHQHTRRGERVLIATVFTADVDPAHPLSDFARTQIVDWGLEVESAMAARRHEDHAAADRLGADIAHLGFLDAMLRPDGNAPRYRAWSAILDGRPRREPIAVDTVADALVALPETARVFVPLGAGHIDHRIVREAAESAIDIDRIVYYDDLPYAEGGLLRGLKTGKWQMKPAVVALDDEDWRAKREALAFYTSQNPGGSLVTAAHSARESRGGERLWHRRGSQVG